MLSGVSWASGEPFAYANYFSESSPKERTASLPCVAPSNRGAAVPQTQSYAPSTLRVEPHMLPMLRVAFHDAATRLQQHLDAMATHAYLPGPWLGDGDSQQMFQHYTDWVMNGVGGPFSAANAYVQRLQDVHDQLKAVEDAYRQAEGDNAALWGKA
jgi:uncharacterized protein YukE